MPKVVTTKTNVRIGESLLIEYCHNEPIIVIGFLDIDEEADPEVELEKEDVDDLISELCAARDKLWPPHEVETGHGETREAPEPDYDPDGDEPLSKE